MCIQSLIVLVPFLALAGCTHSSTQRAANPPSPSADNRFDAGNPVIVRMTGRSKTLTISSTPRGPAYSVSAPDGQILLSQGTLDDLRRLYPDLYRHVRSAVVSVREDVHAAPASPEEPMDFQLLAR